MEAGAGPSIVGTATSEAEESFWLLRNQRKALEEFPTDVGGRDILVGAAQHTTQHRPVADLSTGRYVAAAFHRQQHHRGTGLAFGELPGDHGRAIGIIPVGQRLLLRSALAAIAALPEIDGIERRQNLTARP